MWVVVLLLVLVALASALGARTASAAGPDLSPLALAGTPSPAAPGDRLTLSWTVENAGDAAAGGRAWRDQFWLSADATLNAGDVNLGFKDRNTALDPHGTYQETTLTPAPIPGSVAPGAKYLIVQTDSTAQIAEANEANNAFAVPIEIRRPDLAPSDLVAPASAVAEETITVSFTVTNLNPQEAPAGWVDRIYLSSNGATLDAADPMLKEVVRNSRLAGGGVYSVSTTVFLPIATPAGPNHLIVKTNASGTLAEDDSANNTQAVAIDILPADLVPTAMTGVSANQDVVPGQPLSLGWTVENRGTGQALPVWVDRVYLSSDQAAGGDVLVGSAVRTTVVAAGGSYAVSSANIGIPNNAPAGAQYLLLVVDHDNLLNEDVVGEANNVLAVPITVRKPDLQAVSLAGVPSVVAPTQFFQVTATVENAGDGTALPSWIDHVVLSVDDATLEITDLAVGGRVVTTAVAAGGAYSAPPIGVFIPEIVAGSPLLAGTYTLFFISDQNANVPEANEGNNATSVPITIALPDLALGDLAAPATMTLGPLQSYDVTTSLTNLGQGTAFETFSVRFYLSGNGVFGDADDLGLNGFAQFEDISSGQELLRTYRLNIPASATAGATTLFAKIDDRDDVREADEGNNLTSTAVTILAPDLVPTVLEGAPAAIAPGEGFAVGWTVENRGNTGVAAVQAGNAWEDQLFLSTNATYESGDLFLRQGSRTVPFNDPTYTTAAGNAIVPAGTAAGRYYLILRIDINNEVFEGATGEGNNVLVRGIVVGRPPVANAGGPYAVAEGAAIDLTGAATDPDGETASLAWDLDGDGAFEAAGTTVPFSAVAIDGPASRAVTLRACDPLGLCGTATATVAIENADPAAMLGGGPADEGSPVAIGFSGQADPAAADATTLRYAFACDGGSLAAATWATAADAPATTCTFADGPTTATVRGKVMDDDGGSAEYLLAVEIRNVAPTVDAGPDGAIAEGATFGQNGSFADPGADAWSATVDYGDGSGEQPLALNPDKTFALSHAYVDDGSYTVTVAIRDDADAGAAGFVVTVDAVAPTATFETPPEDVVEGSSVRIALTGAQDPSSPDTEAGFHYAFACHNGDLDDETYETSGSRAHRDCAFEDDEAEPVTVRGRIIDVDGAFTEYDALVTIRNVSPAADFGVPTEAVAEGSPFTLFLANPTDPSTHDVEAGFEYAFDCGDGTGPGPFGSATEVTCTAVDDGNPTVTGAIRDKDGGVHEYGAGVTVTNVAPTATFGAPGSVNEGSALVLSLSDVFDPSSADIGAGFRYAFDCGGGYGPRGSGSTATCTAGNGAGTLAVRGLVEDKDGGATEYAATVTIQVAQQAQAAQIRQPINADGSSVFQANHGSLPIKFSLTANGAPTCDLPPATIVVTRTSGQAGGFVNESVYSSPADSGSTFRITDCQYHYNLDARSLGAGTYRVDIVIDGAVVGNAAFTLK